MATEVQVGGYRLLNLMMTGQTSQVWEAMEPGSGRHFALKVLLPEHEKDSYHRRLLFHEARVGMSMHHPNIIKMPRVSESKSNPHIIMEFFPGGNLKMRLVRKHDVVREKARSIIIQAGSGLAHMHDKGWVHRDIKPDNILVNSAGEVRLIDFALAQRIRRSEGWFAWLGRKKRTAGTRSYMSPEQILNRALDERADVYSFGAAVYEITTGRPPFRGMTPNDLLNKHLKEKPVAPLVANPEVTEECSNLLLRMLAKDKRERPKTMHEVTSAFRQIKIYKTDKLEMDGR
ncbi:MAG TPA: serine/threonine-protein kinase [Gemmatales bacterium]|nr:serine/threonine-protein kinase [Gemmatales bacterium]